MIPVLIVTGALGGLMMLFGGVAFLGTQRTGTITQEIASILLFGLGLISVAVSAGLAAILAELQARPGEAPQRQLPAQADEEAAAKPRVEAVTQPALPDSPSASDLMAALRRPRR